MPSARNGGGGSGRFWLGLLLGISLGSVLRHASSRGFDQPVVRRFYRRWASIYWIADSYLLGQLPRMREMAVERLRLSPGGRVLDLSCGTGANFPHLEERIGSTGRLVGVDSTPEMLEQARRLIEKQGWKNTELRLADATTVDLGEQFDGVLWTLAASVVPDYRQALERAIHHLKPGGWLSIADAKLSERWEVVPLNWVADLVGITAAADVGRRTWEYLPEHLEKVGYRELLLGFLYVTWGQKASE